MKKLFSACLVFVFIAVSAVAYSQEKTQTEVPPVKKVENSEKKDTKKTEIPEEQLLPHRDIKDLPVPYLMKLDKDNTYIMDVKGMKLGLLTYTGRVDGYSLAENIKVNFTEEKWKLQSMQNYKKTVSLSFTKEDRICNVFIEEGFFTTRLEILISVVNSN
ncbi:MAG: hypothetical protein OHK0040_14400 [bacterium]